MKRIEVVQDESAKYRKRKIWFWSIFIFLVVLAALLFYFLTNFKREKLRNIIRVGICGEVHRPAVYNVISGADLAMLVRRANGFTPNADISRVDMDRILMNDTIYHIPGRGRAKTAGSELQSDLAEAMKFNFEELAGNATKDMPEKEIRQINVLYVGFPAVYMHYPPATYNQIPE